MSKIFTVWKDNQYLGLAIKQVAVVPLIKTMTGKKTDEGMISRVLSGERGKAAGCTIIAHHHNDALPFTEKDIERVRAEGWQFIQQESEHEETQA